MTANMETTIGSGETVNNIKEIRIDERFHDFDSLSEFLKREYGDFKVETTLNSPSNPDRKVHFIEFTSGAHDGRKIIFYEMGGEFSHIILHGDVTEQVKQLSVFLYPNDLLL